MKKSIIIIALALVSHCGIAQTWTGSFGKGKALFQQGNHKAATNELLIARKAAQTEYGENHENYRMTVSLLADNYLKMKQFANANTYFLELEKILKQGRNEKTLAFAEVQESLANTYLAGKRIGDAVKRFQTALDLRKKLDPGSKAYATDLHQLAKLYAQGKRYEQGQTYYKELYALSKTLYMKDDPTVYAGIVLEYADLRQAMNRPSEAITLYQEFIKVAGKDEKLVGKTLEAHKKIAQLYAHQEEATKSVESWNKYLSAIGKAKGEKSEEFQEELEKLILLFREMEQFEAAENLLNQKIEKLKTNFGEESPEYAAGLAELAFDQFEAGNIGTAEENVQQAMAIQVSAPGKESAAYARSLEISAEIKNSQENTEEALGLFQEALTTREKVQGKEEPAYAISADRLGYFYLAQQEFVKADTLFTQVMAIREKSVGKRHPDYATSLKNKATLYAKMDTFELAEPLFIQAGTVLRGYYGAGSFEYTLCVKELGDFYLEKGKPNDALKKYTQVLNLLEGIQSDQKKPVERDVLSKIQMIKDEEKEE